MDAALVDHTTGRVSGSSAESASQGNRRSLHPNAGLRQPPDGTKRMSASDRMRLLHGLLDLRTRAVVEPRADMRGACNSRDPIRGPGSGHREIRRPVVDAGQNVAMKIDHKFEKFVHRTPNRAKLAAASRQIYDRKVKKIHYRKLINSLLILIMSRRPGNATSWCSGAHWATVSPKCCEKKVLHPNGWSG
jgi:hypothetical protein